MTKDLRASSIDNQKKLKTFDHVLVLLPTLNEEIAIASTILSIRKELPKAEIVVIDNGSNDNTVQVALRNKARVIHEPHQGKGFAIRKGFREISQQISVIVMLDGDDTYGCENLAEAVHLVQQAGYDMVVGNRIPVSDTGARKPVFKRGHSFGNRFFSSFSTLLHPVGIVDSLSGWRVMSRGFVQSFAGGATGFEIEAELNAHAYLLKCAVENIEVTYKGRELASHSKLNTYKDGLRILKMNLQLFRDNRPQLAFSLFAFPWLISSVTLTWRALHQYFQTGLVLQFPSLIAGVGCFLTALLLMIAGMILQRVKTLRENLAQYQFMNGHSK
jgi:glycosyltransferase involved in cell wall biosynthesis